jgi:hypothetical protein
MSMGWDDVPELLPPTSLFFLLQAVYEYGEPRWNGIGREHQRTRRKICPIPTLPTTNPTRTEHAVNKGSRYETGY